MTYTDTTVVTDELYDYYVIALDTSFNHSVPPNTVSQTAEAKLVAVTFEITVPEWTPGTVYLTRYVNPDGTIGDWNPAATALTKISDTLWRGTFDILDGTSFEFKFTRSSWETVMKGATAMKSFSNLLSHGSLRRQRHSAYEYTVRICGPSCWTHPQMTRRMS